MPSLREMYGNRGGGLRAAYGRRSRTRRQPSVTDLQQEEFALRQKQQELGARAIEQDSPGIFRTLLDILSRPNYAVAGFADELIQGKSVTSAMARSFEELFSGVGPLQGQKEAWGQVLEQAGVGTKTLADAFPILDKTWVGSLGSRGALGLALDIATDPLTYMSFGASTASKVKFLKNGTKYLSPKALELWNKTLVETAKGFKVSETVRDVTGVANRNRKLFEVAEAAEKKFFDLFPDGKIPDDFLDPGGIKIWGKSIVKGETLSSFGRGARKIVESTDFGKDALEQTGKLSIALRRHINDVFHPNGALGNLSPELKDAAIRLRRDFVTHSAAHRQRWLHIIRHGLNDEAGADIIQADLLGRWRKAAKADPDLGKKMYHVQEAGSDVVKAQRLAELSPEHQQIFRDFDRAFMSMRDTLTDMGILEFDRHNYFPHYYKNTREELEQLQVQTPRGGSKPGEFSQDYKRERVFDAYTDAEDYSRTRRNLAARQMGEGQAVEAYPLLDPDYDLMSNFSRYLNRYSNDIARKAWGEQILQTFGRDVASGGKLKELTEALDDVVGATADDVGTIEKFFEEYGGAGATFKEIYEAEKTFIETATEATATTKQAVKEVTANINRTLKRLTPQGKKAFMSRIVQSANSSSQLTSIINGVEGMEDLVPLFRVIREGDPEPALQKLYGEAASYVRVKSKFTGGKVTLLPRIIFHDIENFNSKIIQAQSKGLNKLLSGYDRTNNLFKMGVYTFWPASAIRDAYSNVSQSFLDIGLQAMNPKSHVDAIAIMAGKNLDVRIPIGKTGGSISRREFRDFIVDYGIWVPGEVFVEQTGKRIKNKALKGLANTRGLIENEARVQLALANVRRGVPLREAADHVRDFLFDYGELSSFEREFMRRLIPFYTFTRKNIALQLRTLRRNPGMQINQLKPFRGYNEENDAMVKWEGEALKLRLDKDGKTLHVLTGIDLPLRNLDTLWRGTLGTTLRTQIGMITPVVKTTMELAAGRDFFTNRDLTRTTSGALGRAVEVMHTPQPVKDWLGYKKEVDGAGRPRYTFDAERYSLLVRSWLFSRFFSTSDRVFREYLGGTPDLQAAALDVLTGIRYKELDMDEQQRRKLQRRIKELEVSLEKRGELARYTRRYTPKRTGT